MAKKKIYAVKKGKKTGIFLTWEECKAAVDGYSGAEYKSFFSKEDAEEYLDGGKNPLLNLDAENDVNNKENQIVAYVDGSFNKELGKYAFGCVLIKPDGEIIRESGNGDNPESLELGNVTGEMLGAMYAVKWCEINGYSAVIICYDYMGIEMWATGGWKANKNLTQKYAVFMQESSRRIRITFHKIAAHTGDKYNEEADKLAKAALVDGNGIPKIKKVQSEGE
ncbi:MAG: ribonuclease H family protein [Lachnospiraceae bacterium]|nr:ribonuclease H family protein [Lachnospiraceae bacterium]MDE7204232.1 ribonuclease H family protein [Lachnospiraceae bacterium]